MNAKAERKRLDLLLVERGLAESRHKAQAMILAGEVEVDRQRAGKAGLNCCQRRRILRCTAACRNTPAAAALSWKARWRIFAWIRPAKFAWIWALRPAASRIACCRIRRGSRLRRGREHRPIELEAAGRQARAAPSKKNARDLRAEDLPEAVELVVADVSFISVTKILPGAVTCAKPGAEFLILIKPQFELEREDVGKGGIVREKALHEKAIASVRQRRRSPALEHFRKLRPAS